MHKIITTLATLLAIIFTPELSAQSSGVSDTILPDANLETKEQAAPAAKTDSVKVIPAETVEALTQAADSAYSADNFALAEKIYTQILADHGSSAMLFYNLGNTCYRQGKLGMAIVNYERSLKLDPTNADTRANLEFVKSKITDRQIDSGSFLFSVWETVVMWFKADTWAWIALVLFALMLAGILTYLLSSVVLVKKICFFGGIIIMFLCAGAIIFSFAAANRQRSNTAAIVLSPSSQLSTTPREARTQSEEAFTLHEGTKVEIVDSVSSAADGRWYEVRVGQNERAWIKASDIERI